MEFSPNNNTVQLCLQGMNMQESGNTAEATTICTKAWNDATNNFEKFLAAWFIARRHFVAHTGADRSRAVAQAVAVAVSLGRVGTVGDLVSVGQTVTVRIRVRRAGVLSLPDGRRSRRWLRC